MVLLHRRRDGVEGIYSCVIPDAMNVTQTIYIGMYLAVAGQLLVSGMHICSHTEARAGR